MNGAGRRRDGDAAPRDIPVRGDRQDRSRLWSFRPDPPPCFGVAVIRDGIHRIAVAEEDGG